MQGHVPRGRWKHAVCCGILGGAMPCPESCLAVDSAHVACGDDSVATFNTLRYKEEAYVELPLAPPNRTCWRGLRCARADGGRLWASCPVPGAGRKAGRVGREQRKGNGTSSNSYIYFLYSERRKQRPVIRNHGGEGPPGQSTLPGGDAMVVGSGCILGLA